MVNKEKKSKSDQSTVSIKQVRSGIGCVQSQLQTLRGLKLGKIGRTSTLENTDCVKGMIRKVAHLVKVGE